MDGRSPQIVNAVGVEKTMKSEQRWRWENREKGRVGGQAEMGKMEA